MSEILDGVLSETLLNEIAEDLGITPSQLRENPVFRVLKGRVLLTYPLKIPEPQFTEYTYSEILANLATFTPPAKTIVMVASLNGQVQNLNLMYGTDIIRAGTSLAATEAGFYGSMYCDGFTGFKNVGVQAVLRLAGVTMA